MVTQEVLDQIEQMAKKLVLMDLSDVRALADLHTDFNSVGAWAREDGHDLLGEVVAASAILLETIILDEIDDVHEALEDVGRVVTNLQFVLRDTRDIREMVWPARLRQSYRAPVADGHLKELRFDGGDATGGGNPAPRSGPVSEPWVPKTQRLEGDRGLLVEFVAEATEHLDAADVNLLNLETDPQDEGFLNAVFRAFHTIKGVAGFLALDEVLILSHQAENLLDCARKHELQLNASAMDVTFDAVDQLKHLMANVKTALENDGVLSATPELPALLARIKTIVDGNLPTSSASEPMHVASSERGATPGDPLVDSDAATPEAIEQTQASQQSPEKPKIGEILIAQDKTTPTHVDLAFDVQEQNPEQGRLGEILTDMQAVSPEEVQMALEQQEPPSPGSRPNEIPVASGGVAVKDVAQALRTQKTLQQPVIQIQETVKVNAERLDLLVDMIGELVIAESMVSQSDELRAACPPDLARSIGQLDRTTRELQEMGTSLRMVPIRATFQRMARLARDLTRKSGKRIEFVTSGDETELDKNVVDKIGDPLMHMIRNAVDHGIEAHAEERIQAGKPPVARLELRAFHKGGNIYIEIQDDGCGLNRERILASALARGLVRDGDALTDREVWHLVFEPGLSTAKKVTAVSGRGVGMDVAKRNIEALRGQIEVRSETGKGTLFSMRLPLTLAIIDGMVARVATERYVIPTLSVVRLIRPEDRQLSTFLDRCSMLEIEGTLIPLLHLARLFDVPGAVENPEDGVVMVVEEEGRHVGFLVDEILGQQQTVIKSLSDALPTAHGISGCAIMPDGSVGLILDVGSLVQIADEEKDNDIRIGELL